MRNSILTTLVVLLILFFCQTRLCGQQDSTTDTAKSVGLPRSTPEAQGISSSAIFEFLKSADEEIDSLHSFMLVRNSHVVAAAWWKPNSAEKPHVLWSLSKSFASTAVGLVIAEGKLSLDDKVVEFFPNELPAKPSKNLQAMRVRDLLTMSAGHSKEVENLQAQSDWIKSFLAHDVPHQPGSHFQYNTPATFMLSAIVQKVTGKSVLEYLQPKLFAPLAIKKPRWDTNPQNITLGGYGLYLCTEDIAKFGQLYLQKGKWQGQQIVPEDWVEQATSKQVSNGSDPNNDWNQGYGFQFWRCRHDAYRGDGRDGQFCIVMPKQNAVVAITANTNNMGAIMNLVWDKLLPAFQEKPLTADKKNLETLRGFVKKLDASR